MTGRTSNTKRSLMSASSSSEAAASTSISANKSRTELSKRTKRRQRREAADLEEEERLTNLLFTTDGSAQHDDGPLQRRPWKEQAGDGETSLFTFDRTGDPSVDRDDLEKASESESILEDGAREDSATKAHDSAAWVDQDDEVIRVDILETSRLRKLRNSRLEATDMTGKQLESRLRKQFRTTTELTARTDWARVEKADGTAVESEGEKTDEELVNVSSSAPLLVPTCDRPSLPANTLDIVRCPDANLADPNSAVIQSVNFHPASDSDRPLLLTAGLDKTLRFFQVGEEKSTKVHGIHFPKLPIYSASFLGTTGNVVVSGRRSFFYVYDAAAGKLDMIPRISGREERSLEKFAASSDGRTIAFVGNDGYVILFDIQAKQWIADLKLNGSVRALCFTSDGEQLIASGSDGDVYRWDIKSRRCVERFPNLDGTITSSLASSSRYLAVGAESGVVNLYNSEANSIHQHGPTLQHQRPLTKSIMNLHTSADTLRFNPDGQILALSTRRETHGLRLLHMPTATVFANWPTSKTPLNYVWSTDFSPESRFLAVGNDKGMCLLYKLEHYRD